MSNQEAPTVFTASRKEDCFYLFISNSLKEHDTPKLEGMFQKAMTSSCRFLLVDCHNMRNISIAALRTFLSNMGLIQARGMKMGIYGLNPELMDSLSSSGMDSLLTIGETEKEVIQLLKKNSGKK